MSFTFTALLPDDARFWGTLALSALALGLLLVGAATLVTARAEAKESS